MATTKTTTVTATSTATQAVDYTKMFSAVLKHWPKQAGEKVTNEQLATAASLIKRHGTAKHLALAMYFRAEGATQGEVIIATGDTNVNAYNDAHKTKVANVVNADRRNNHKVYKLALPAPKAVKAKAAKPASKPAGTRKQASKAKVTPQAETQPETQPEANTGNAN